MKYGWFMNYAMKYHYLELLKWGKNKKLPINYRIYEKCGQFGFVEGLKWLYKLDKQTFVYHANKIQQLAAAEGYLNILQWLHTNHIIMNATTITSQAAYYGQLHILQWFSFIYPVYFWKNAFYHAVQGNHLVIVQWLLEQGCSFDFDLCIGIAEKEIYDYLQTIKI